MDARRTSALRISSRTWSTTLAIVLLSSASAHEARGQEDLLGLDLASEAGIDLGEARGLEETFVAVDDLETALLDRAGIVRGCAATSLRELAPVSRVPHHSLRSTPRGGATYRGGEPCAQPASRSPESPS